MKLTRRTALRRGGAAVALGALAGCLSEPGDDTENGSGNESGENAISGYAAFFALWDWSNQIVGDHGAFENPVDVGEMGHGWNPGGDLTRDVAETDAFVYLDTPEFSWAQDLAAQLEAEEESVDSTVIDGMAGLTADQLLPFSTGERPDPDEEYTVDPSNVQVDGFDIIDPRTGETVAYWHVDHWDGGLPDVPLEGSMRFEAVVEVDGGHVIPLGGDEDVQLDARLGDGAPDEMVDIESHGDAVELHGIDVGRTLVVFELRQDGDVLWDSSADTLSVDVSDDIDPADATEFHDPHVWADPVLAANIVDAIADGLAEVSPDDAETFEANADAYNERLSAVDEQFQATVDDAQLDIAVFAGHDSFRYLEHRYGFDLHSPIGVSPDESPSPSEIAETIELVNENAIDTILYDPFEAGDGEVPPLAETIVEDSSATEVAPLTPAEGTLPDWDDRGWGWVEQMEEITLPSLRAALKAE
ncbi:metal ABC transporter substrate-binding protein [Natronosalvus vescus]|uniref:metal ABC transporter substrate-binding protein n=1 Tax=Natronosalvus vescus TaxID=2953881 RepID=UPI0020908E4E|nr:metal ABC transporter substrate-binding protein [Natronosalvus vescus]